MQNEERINGLENQVRTLKRIVYGFGCLLVTGIVVGATTLQTVPEVIQAKRFQVVNDEGNVIVEMNSVLHEGEHYGFVTTRNGKGQRLVALGATFEGNGVVTTENGKGQDLVRLGATTEGEGMVTTENGKGQTLVELGVTTGGEGMVSTENGKGQSLVRLGATTGGQGMVKTENGKGQTLVELGATKNGGSVTTENGKGQTLVSLSTTTGGGTGCNPERERSNTCGTRLLQQVCVRRICRDIYAVWCVNF